MTPTGTEKPLAGLSAQRRPRPLPPTPQERAAAAWEAVCPQPTTEPPEPPVAPPPAVAPGPRRPVASSLADLTADVWRVVARHRPGAWSAETGKWDWLIPEHELAALNRGRDAGRIVTVQTGGELLAGAVPVGLERLFRSDGR